jgi:hypothetical protein
MLIILINAASRTFRWLLRLRHPHFSDQGSPARGTVLSAPRCSTRRGPRSVGASATNTPRARGDQQPHKKPTRTLVDSRAVEVGEVEWITPRDQPAGGGRRHQRRRLFGRLAGHQHDFAVVALHQRHRRRDCACGEARGLDGYAARTAAALFRCLKRDIVDVPAPIGR